eukprot:CAMPEP_0168336382 /NCGR_PEP_ID=MMETSP0213-20121227/11508_1 /TAXON_ID=151035 /ORGANISM="Euplotes harpa, Strain FSP1.4" /LENGTH=187 /DNA_ID=CAMNT_0008341563 /DNA_START=261 /DNA_END=820 /DNA_ORIENTATION=-
MVKKIPGSEELFTAILMLADVYNHQFSGFRASPELASILEVFQKLEISSISFRRLILDDVSCFHLREGFYRTRAVLLFSKSAFARDSSQSDYVEVNSHWLPWPSLTGRICGRLRLSPLWLPFGYSILPDVWKGVLWGDRRREGLGTPQSENQPTAGLQARTRLRADAGMGFAGLTHCKNNISQVKPR